MSLELIRPKTEVGYVRVDAPGCVVLDGYFGDDSDIARIARVSTGGKSKGRWANARLIESLIRDDHGSPLEMGVLRYRMRMPLFVVMQLLRHRMASPAQRSGRYVEFELEFCEAPTWKVQGGRNRQVSGEPLAAELQEKADAIYRKTIEAAAAGYTSLLELGVAREQARMVLPQATYTDIFLQINIRSLMNLLWLREAPDAQPEFRVYALAMHALFNDCFPQTCRIMEKAFRIRRKMSAVHQELWEIDSDTESEGT